ncbi:MAG: AraC family transcriptional regulator, partial [Lachnospiraceae bacterium]|nr:AraC family transcriptional regulator [Lachnospiraceae bacterium]
FYGGIANTTLVTRYAIEGGMDEEKAFSLSDIYIKRMESCTTPDGLEQLNQEMAIDFTRQVAEAKTKKYAHCSGPILQTMHLIYEHSHEKILLEDLARQVGLSPKYLSYLFKKEAGQTISSYILDMRIEEAKHLLAYTDYTSSQISQYLAFHSQSYFIQVFKKATQLTPNQYRNKQGLTN